MAAPQSDEPRELRRLPAEVLDAVLLLEVHSQPCQRNDHEYRAYVKRCTRCKGKLELFVDDIAQSASLLSSRNIRKNLSLSPDAEDDTH